MSAIHDDPLELRTHVDVPDDPTEVFGAVVERNDHVCRRCYRILGRRERVPDEDGDTYADVVASIERPDDLEGEFLEDVQLGERAESAYPPMGPPTTGGSRACWNCGAIDTHRTPDTRSVEDAVRAAAGVSTTLVEYGVDHDWLYLLGRVGALKRTPEYAGNDYRVFSTAVAEAIEAARATNPTRTHD